ncbi:MAG: helix-turn-helix domain-containing protein [Pseudomonadota bacterium]
MSPEEIIAQLRSAIEATHHPEIMTPAQAADFLGVSEDYLRDRRKDRSGPPYSQPASKVIRYEREDLIKWMRRSKREA